MKKILLLTLALALIAVPVTAQVFAKVSASQTAYFTAYVYAPVAVDPADDVELSVNGVPLGLAPGPFVDGTPSPRPYFTGSCWRFKAGAGIVKAGDTLAAVVADVSTGNVITYVSRCVQVRGAVNCNP